MPNYLNAHSMNMVFTWLAFFNENRPCVCLGKKEQLLLLLFLAVLLHCVCHCHRLLQTEHHAGHFA